MSAATCRSCGASIVWATTPSGKVMPLDAFCSTVGTIRLNADGSCTVMPALARVPGEPLHTSHFATCPDAAAHRKPRTS